jgi:PAS domain S-box-containing protein
MSQPALRAAEETLAAGRAAPRQLVQVLLALAALAAVATAVYVGHRMLAVFGASLADNQAWSNRLLSYASLSQLATDVVTPGNDIFQSRNVRPETRKFYTSRAVVNQAMTNARRELVQHVERADAAELIKDFAALRRTMKLLVADVRQVFQAFREEDIDRALRRQATMNRRAVALRAAFVTLNRHLGEVAEGRFAKQGDAVGRLAVVSRWIAVLLAAGIAGVFAYGRRTERRNSQLLTAQRGSLAALRESEARKGAILASALDAVVTIDHEGRILEFNLAAERIFRYPRDTVIGRRLTETIIPPAQREAHRRGFARYLATRKSTLLGSRIEVTAMRADGEEFPAELAICEIPGPVPTFTATARDITERKSAERELSAARDSALDAARLKSDFVANVSHEIRTPLHIIFGMADMLLDSPLATEQREHVLLLRRNAQGLLRIINDVLDFSKIEAGKLRLERVPFSLRDALTDLLKAFSPHAQQKGLALEIEVDAAVPDAVVGDPTRVRQVLVNLVDNAIKFTERGGVRVEASVETVSPDAAVVKFAVADTGVGVPREKRAEIFEAFAQADGSTTRRYGGTGLGLTISRQLVALMAGDLRVESEPGRGSTFSFSVALEIVSQPPARLRSAG